jgi:hypothetical protein
VKDVSHFSHELRRTRPACVEKPDRNVSESKRHAVYRHLAPIPAPW